MSYTSSETWGSLWKETCAEWNKAPAWQKEQLQEKLSRFAKLLGEAIIRENRFLCGAPKRRKIDTY